MKDWQKFDGKKKGNIWPASRIKSLLIAEYQEYREEKKRKKILKRKRNPVS